MSPKRLPSLALLLWAAPAVAEEKAASVGVGFAGFSTIGVAKGKMEPPALGSDVGGALSLEYERAIGTDFGLRAEAVTGLFYGGIQDPKKQSNVSYAGLVDVGGTVKFDVLKYVPYAFGGLGAVISAGGPIDTSLDMVVVVGGGLDILSSRKRSWGVQAKVASFGGDITVFSVGVRGTSRWGFF
jgi:hypothetical protein